jgi:hypothetical protein
MAKLYDLKGCLLTVGGVGVSGYGTDDAVSFEWAADIVETFDTIDGRLVYVRTNKTDMVATITLMQTSPAIPLLRAQLDFQHGPLKGPALPVIIPAPFYFSDPTLGDFCTGPAVFLNRPGTRKGREVGELQFRLSLVAPVYQLGAFNVAGV